MMLMRPSSGFGATVSCGSSLSSASSSSSSSTSPLKRRLLTMTRSSIRIAVVGDVHDDWDLQEDGKALQFLQVTLAMKMLTLLGALLILNFQKQLFWEIMIAGLGSQTSDICGRDWVLEGGDHGDPDLAQAIADLKEGYKLSIPLVIFGHMHKQLAYRRGLRKMVVHGTDGIIYLNGAVVPRVKRLMHTQEASISNSVTTSSRLTVPKPRGSVREFTVVEMLDGKLVRATESWVSVTGDATKLEEEHVFYNQVEDHIP
ncbi:hypothetical protein EJ110_NYTH11327 [Nymphaea thermarum]|nr:hypothetical protein EJ110_NYTH11327 [Nymphaea thermarum]